MPFKLLIAQPDQIFFVYLHQMPILDDQGYRAEAQRFKHLPDALDEIMGQLIRLFSDDEVSLFHALSLYGSAPGAACLAFDLSQ